MTSSNYRMYCAVHGCLNTLVSKPGLAFFKVPSQRDRQSEWLHLMGRDDLKEKPNGINVRVCEEHFPKESILPSSARKVLTKNAIPSLKLPQFEPKSVKRNKYTQTDAEDSAKELNATKLDISTLRIKRLRAKLFECRKKLEVYESQSKEQEGKNDDKALFHQLCDKFLTKDFALIVKAQADL